MHVFSWFVFRDFFKHCVVWFTICFWEGMDKFYCWEFCLCFTLIIILTSSAWVSWGVLLVPSVTHSDFISHSSHAKHRSVSSEVEYLNLGNKSGDLWPFPVQFCFHFGSSFFVNYLRAEKKTICPWWGCVKRWFQLEKDFQIQCSLRMQMGTLRLEFYLGCLQVPVCSWASLRPSAAFITCRGLDYDCLPRKDSWLYGIFPRREIEDT
jgi:hypothetical protein